MDFDDLQFDEELNDLLEGNKANEENDTDSPTHEHIESDDDEGVDDNNASEEDEYEEDDEPETKTKKEEVETDPELVGLYRYLENSSYLIPDEDFEFDGTDEGFQVALDQTKENLRLEVFGDLLERLPEKTREAVEFSLKSGGRDLEDFMAYDTAVDWENLDYGDPDVQKAVLVRYYRTVSNYDDARIEKQIERLERNGDLQEEALLTVGELREIEEQQQAEILAYHQQQIAAQEQQEKQYMQNINTAIDKLDSIEPARKQKVKNFLFNTKRGPNGQYTDYNLTLTTVAAVPEHFAQLADFLADYDQSTGFNTERYTKRAKTSVVKNIKSQIADLNSTARYGISGTPQKPKGSNFNLAAYLKDL